MISIRQRIKAAIVYTQNFQICTFLWWNCVYWESANFQCWTLRWNRRSTCNRPSQHTGRPYNQLDTATINPELMKGCAEVVTNCWRQLYSFTAGLALLAAAVLSWSGSAPRTPEQDYFSCFFKQKSSSIKDSSQKRSHLKFLYGMGLVSPLSTEIIKLRSQTSVKFESYKQKLFVLYS